MSQINNPIPLGTGVATFLATPSSANLATAVTNETGSGALVFGTAPTIAGGSITGLTGLAIRDTSAAFDVTLAATSSVALDAGRALTLNMGNVAHTLAFGTTANTITFPNAASGTVPLLNLAQTFTATQTFANITMTGTTFAATNASSFQPQFSVYNQTNDQYGPYFLVKKGRAASGASAAVQVNDYIGNFLAQGADSDGTLQNAGGFLYQVDSVTSGTVVAHTDFITGASVPFRITSASAYVLTTTASTTSTNGALIVSGGAGVAKAIFAGEKIISIGPTFGVGYGTGAGGAVTQATNRNTGVTINKVCGEIVLFSQINAAVSAATATEFTVTNSAVAATDTILACQKSGTDRYLIFVTAVAAGSFRLTYWTTGGVTNEAPVFSFSVIKAVTA